MSSAVIPSNLHGQPDKMRRNEMARMYRQKRILNMSAEQLAIERERRRLRDKQRRQKMTEEQRLRERERHRKYYHRRKGILNVGVSNDSTKDGFHSDRIYGMIQKHVQSEVDRLSERFLPANLDLGGKALNIHIGNFNDVSTTVVPLKDDINGYDNSFPGDANISYRGDIEGQEDVSSTRSINSNRTRKVPSTCRSSHNCARDYVYAPNFQQFEITHMHTCEFCHAELFPSESRVFCCLRGKVKLPLLPTPPDLMYLYASHTDEAVHFRQNIRSYNHVFSFTSMGVHLDENLASGRRGIYTYRAQGSIYHKIGGLLPQVGQRPRYLQMYVYDTDHELVNRQAENNLLNPQVLSILQRVLDEHNPFVHTLRRISQSENIQDIRLLLKEKPCERHHYTLPTSSQVAAILVGGDDPAEMGERDIVVETVTGDFLNVPDTAGFYDPLQYPLLHPYGNFGWDLHIFSNDARRITCREFYCYMLQIRSDYDSPLFRAGRLLQQFVVDIYVKISTQQLRYIRDSQDAIRAELYQGLQDSMASGETNAANIGQRTILPSSYIGSPRDMHERYHDAMALVQKFGKPDIFLTMTCNPNWVDIKRRLLPGQLPQDRPELTTRVFREKLEELKNDLFSVGVLGRVAAHVHVIEFQKRGLPHAHILLILDEADKLISPDDYDRVVRAEIPDPINEPDLYNIVVKHMIHGPCGSLKPDSVCMKNGACKKGFPKSFSAITFQGNDSYPIYQRRDNSRSVLLDDVTVDNRWVVPYNPWLLLKYDCHINVEVCSSIKSVKYLYKYVYKGFDRVSMGVSTSAPRDHDEIKQFMDARWVCPQESLWRIFRFPLNRMYPAVYALQIHLPNMHQVIFSENQDITALMADDKTSRTMLTEFFLTNAIDPEARQYLYKEFPEHYTWNKSDKHWRKRRNSVKVIGRLRTAHPSDSERYFLRILLNHVRGPTSFEELKTVGSRVCTTFKEAAELRGLLECDNSIHECLMEAAAIHMPSALRRLFGSILVYCNPIGVRDLWNEFHPYMLEDYVSTIDPNAAINRLLRELETFLAENGKKLSSYDLPAPSTDSDDHSNLHSLIAEERTVIIPPEDLSSINSLNDSQMNAFRIIVHSVHRHESSVYFIDGPGGTGKTFLYRSILAYLRNNGHIAIATSTSGLAATMLPGGRTAHSRFKIPVPTDSRSMCRIGKRSPLAELLRQSSLIIWDEATMSHRHAFEALDRTLQDLTDSNLPFGGKIFVLGGDFRQVLPVVPHGTIAEKINACITKSDLWRSAKVIHLTENMRAKSDPSFSDMLLRIGDGSEPCVLDDMIKIPDDMIIPWDNEHSLLRLISSVFPTLPENAQDKNYIAHRALLTLTNEYVDQLNDIVIQMFPGEDRIFYSFDSVENDPRHLYQQEFLNSISTGGLAPHKLTLKLGSPILLLRNLDPVNGLCNGTRLLCRGFRRNVIYAEILSGSHVGKPAFLHRIPMKPSVDLKLPFDFTRKQFPIRLGFALTVHKSQGQTLPHAGTYLPDHVFDHGQLYVALSRGVSRSTTKLLVKKGVLSGFEGTFTKNVVYKDVLRSCNVQLYSGADSP